VKPFRSGQGLVVLFAVTILVPGALLFLFGVRGLLQEQGLAQQQLREGMESAADEMARNLRFEVSRWQQAVDGLAIASGATRESQPPFPPEMPARVLVIASGSATRVWPQAALLYQIGHQAALPAMPLPEAIAAAEMLEFRGELAEAASRYRALLKAGNTQFHPLLLQRLARTLRKNGERERALQAYRQLLQMPDAPIGTLPSSLVARFELIAVLHESGNTSESSAEALALYRTLVEGKWLLDKARYLYYAEVSAARAAEDSANATAVTELRARESKKLALTDAVAQLIESPRRAVQTEDGILLAFWRRETALLALAVTEPGAFFSKNTVEAERRGTYGTTVTAPGDILVHGSASAEVPAMLATRSIPDGDFAWQLRVWPADPTALTEEVGWRQSVYLAVLILVGGLLAFGGYFIFRTVQREMEVARLKSDFVSAVSHEFRSPLSGIRQLAEMLERGRVKDDQKRQQYYTLLRPPEPPGRESAGFLADGIGPAGLPIRSGGNGAMVAGGCGGVSCGTAGPGGAPGNRCA
jgi:tetratricopeptide (TPR) repeat protein